MSDGRSATVLGMVLILFLCSAASGVAQGWTSAKQVSSTAGPAGGAIYQGLGIDSRGRIHAFWNDDTSGPRILFRMSEDGGATWSPERSLVDGAAWTINVAVGPDDVLHLAWIDPTDGGKRIRYTRSIDRGQSFESPRSISLLSVTGEPGPPCLGVDANGRVHLAWHHGNPESRTGPRATVWYTRSTDNGATFEAPRQLSRSTGHAAFPRFDIQGTSGERLAIAWRDERRSPDWDVYLAYSGDGGATFAELPARTSSEVEWDPTAAVAPNGRIHLGWMTYRQAGGITVDVAYSDDAAATWSQPVTVSEGFSRFPFWVTDWRRGTLWVFWKDEANYGTPPCTGMNHCADVAARYSRDGGLTWSAVEKVVDRGTVEVKFPSPSMGPDGRPALTWSDDSLGTEQLFFSSRLAAPVAGGGSSCAEADLCLRSGRFRVGASWRAHDGSTGLAHPIPFSEESGGFWFFSPSNLELFVKVLDGCPLNQNYWVFAAGLTDVEVHLEVEDLLTGQLFPASTSLGEPFPPILSTTALATCP